MGADSIYVSGALLDRLGALGIDTRPLLARAGLPASRFADRQAQLSTSELFALWNAIDAASDRDLALRIASAEPPATEWAAQAALRASNLGEALQTVARYKRLCCAEEVELQIAKGEASLTFFWPFAESPDLRGGKPRSRHALTPPRMLIEAAFASTVALARRGTGVTISPLRIELARRRGDHAMLAAHFGCPIRFDRPHDRLVLREADLARTFLTRDPTRGALLPALEASLRDSLARRSLAQAAEAQIRRAMSGAPPRIETIAKSLGLTPRTLQRRLAESRTSYGELLARVRDETARRLLADTELDPGEIAFLLGFDELNSFSRAFHSRAGKTPLRWRAALRPRAASELRR